MLMCKTMIFIFCSLYKVLFVTLDGRHEPFFLWIKDLSERDPTSIFNLFCNFSITGRKDVRSAWTLYPGKCTCFAVLRIIAH